MLVLSKETIRTQLKKTIRFSFQLLRSGLITSIFLIIQSYLLIRSYKKQNNTQKQKISTDLYQAGITGLSLGGVMLLISVIDWVTYYMPKHTSIVRSIIVNYVNYLGWFNQVVVAYTIGLSIANIIAIGSDDTSFDNSYTFIISVSSLVWTTLHTLFMFGFLLNYWKYKNPIQFLV